MAKKKNQMIRSSHHSTKFMREGKADNLSKVLDDYEKAVRFYVDWIWNTRIEWKTSEGIPCTFDIKNNQYDLPPFISTTELFLENTCLSAKLFKSASQQALGIVRSGIAKHKKLLFKLELAILRGDAQKADKFQKQVNKSSLTKPNPKVEYANLDSNTLDFVEENEDDEKFVEFDGFLRITSLSRMNGNIYIPIKFHRHVNRLRSRGFSRMTSWLIGKDSVRSLWSCDKPPKRTSGKKLGLDQGLKTCVTMSDGQVTHNCPHGHNLETISAKMALKKKGSKQFNKAQFHRTNYTNWAFKRIDLTGVSQIGYEHIYNLKCNNPTSRDITHWSYATIRTTVYRTCEELGVLVSEQSTTYRSQRCSICGFTHSKNRAKKQFTCIKCGNSLDADLNGALNHEVELVDVPWALSQLGLNKKEGFYWKPDGFFNLAGQEITVPVAQGTKNI